MSYRNPPAEAIDDHLIQCATQQDLGDCVNCDKPAYHKQFALSVTPYDAEPFCCECVRCEDGCGECDCDEIETGQMYDAGESRWEEATGR